MLYHSYEVRMISTTFLLKLTEYQMNIHVPFNQCINISGRHSVHSVLQTHHMWEKINAHKLDLSDGANTNTYVSWHHEGECCIIVRAGMANCVQASLSMLNTIFQLSKCHDYKNIYIWLRDTSLEIHKSRLMFCSLTCVFARVCSEWMNGVWGVTEFNLLSLICQSLRKQDWLVPAFPKYDFPIFFSHNVKVSLLKNVKWSC